MNTDPMDKTSQAAILAIFVGWFFLNTLAVTLGSFQHGLRFFDISAVIADPTRIFFGVDSWPQRILFGSLCVACLAAPIVARRQSPRWERLALVAPLLLMLVCGVILYSKTSSEFFSAPSDLNSVGHRVIHLANTFARQGGGLVSRHVTVGLGGYVALAGSVVLAFHGLRRRKTG